PRQGRGAASPDRHTVRCMGTSSYVARHINDLRGIPRVPVSQRNYCERIVRSERELATVRRYIRQNPANWAGGNESRTGGARGA
ncbi:MAG: hypothetical protein QME94_13770, partial [Anaerolineae bacterium]|nr:hypothetical protein [Anaerolineae bacterium]